MRTSRWRGWSRLVCGLACIALAVAPGVAAATPGDDSYIEGYAAAVLEREFRLAAPSMRVQNGVVTVSASDVAGVDRDRIIAALGRIRGVTRVDEVDRVAPLVATAPGRGRCSRASSSAARGRDSTPDGAPSRPSTSRIARRTTGTPTSPPGPAFSWMGFWSRAICRSCSSTFAATRPTGSSTERKWTISASACTSIFDPRGERMRGLS